MSKCLHCGGEKVTDRTATSGQIDYTVWRVSVDKDPFCSRLCCELHHETNTVFFSRECGHCGTEFQLSKIGRGQDRRYCSRPCKEAAANTRRRLQVSANSRAPGCCVECGCPHSEQTQGCYACWQRDHSRRRRAKDSAAPAADLPRRPAQAMGRPSTTDPESIAA